MVPVEDNSEKCVRLGGKHALEGKIVLENEIEIENGDATRRAAVGSAIDKHVMENGGE